MTYRATSLLLMSVIALGACASAVPVVDHYKASSETLRQFQRISIFDDSAGQSGNVRELGLVEGIYCKKVLNSKSVARRISKLDAIDQVKLKAAELGADYITPPQCEFDGKTDFSNNCYEKMYCKATALSAD